MLSQKPLLVCHFQDGDTVIHILAREKKYDVIKRLHDIGVDVNAPNKVV